MSPLKGHFVAAPHDTGDPVTGHYYETASNDPGCAQVWGYTSHMTCKAGDRLALHVNASAPRVRVTILRDALVPEVVLETEIDGGFAATPADCSVQGCGWPERLAIEVPSGWRSGVYVVRLVIPGHASDHMFVLRPSIASDRVLMILATGTWCAYNDWGGSNHYQGLTGKTGQDYAAHVSLLRPWARGFVRWPQDAPRIPHSSPLLEKPRYPHMEYARANGISKKYASSGWAAFERPFALWCEANGIGLDFATQHDLHRDPGLLAGYDRALIVGHDEYWTWAMRDHLEGWLDLGGRLCRFAGNFFWQTRLSDDLLTQTCFKSRAEAEDPAMQGDPQRLTSYWDHVHVGRPAVQTMGLTGSAGVYAGWSRCAAHGSGGFTVYRPRHWALSGTGLGYGDVLGAEAKVFGYEVDGIDYVMEQGLPFASDETGLREALEIVALSPATTLAHSGGDGDADDFIGTVDAEELAEKVYGGGAEALGRAERGNGAMAVYRRGRGAVFNAGSCEWVAGLIRGDRAVGKVTRNVVAGEWG